MTLWYTGWSNKNGS